MYKLYAANRSRYRWMLVVTQASGGAFVEVAEVEPVTQTRGIDLVFDSKYNGRRYAVTLKLAGGEVTTVSAHVLADLSNPVLQGKSAGGGDTPIREVTDRSGKPFYPVTAAAGVQMPDGTHPTVMSCSSAESYLKNSTDTATRRQVFGAYNAWFAENAAPFAALLNAMTGHRLNLSDRAGMSMLDASLKSERMSRPAFDAMMRAVRAAAPRARNAVQLSGMVLSCLEGRRSGLSVANLFAPLPEAAPLEAAASFDGAADALRRTFSRIDPDFQGFLKLLLSAGWIETSNISGGEGGTWCAQVPACSSVAVYADYQPTLNRACELAHILGEASLRDRLIAYPAIAQNPSLLSCEIAGRFFMDAFLAQLLEETEWERREHAAVLWQALRQIGVNLLHLPFRFELSHRLHEERRHGYLSVNDINKLTNTIWEDYFADTVRGSDQYVWAAKLHFYLPREPHYDWQYTAGYLIAAVLRRRLLADGCTACGGSFGDFLSDCATIDCDELIRRHLGADPASDAFWTDAATEALNVMRDADRHIQAFIS